jgi:hypothetical protein
VTTLDAPRLLAVSDRTNPVPRLPQHGLSSFISSVSELHGLKLCNKYQQCKKPLCPWCSTRRATEARRRLAPLARTSDSILVMRLSVPVGTSLPDLWYQMEDARLRFLDNGFLTSRSSAWWIQKDLTRTPAGFWNLHLNVLVFDAEPELRTTGPERWEWASGAAVTAQYAEHWTNPHKAIAYHVRGLMHQKKNHDRDPGDGYSPGDLLALAAHGDADALSAWTELEHLISAAIPKPRHKPKGNPISTRRRWYDSGGALRAGVSSRADVALAA